MKPMASATLGCVLFAFSFSVFISCFHFLKTVFIFKILEFYIFGLISCFLLSRNKNTENVFSKGNVFLDLLKITFLVTAFSFYPK